MGTRRVPWSLTSEPKILGAPLLWHGARVSLTLRRERAFRGRGGR